MKPVRMRELVGMHTNVVSLTSTGASEWTLFLCFVLCILCSASCCLVFCGVSERVMEAGETRSVTMSSPIGVRSVLCCVHRLPTFEMLGLDRALPSILPSVLA